MYWALVVTENIQTVIGTILRPVAESNSKLCVPESILKVCVDCPTVVENGKIPTYSDS